MSVWSVWFDEPAWDLDGADMWRRIMKPKIVDLSTMFAKTYDEMYDAGIDYYLDIDIPPPPLGRPAPGCAECKPLSAPVYERRVIDRLMVRLSTGAS